MEKRFYLDGKCILSYDIDVFPSDEDYTNIMELFIYPIYDRVFEKYYEKTLVCEVLEKVLKKNAIVYKAYCDIKPLIENEEISRDYLQEEDTLLKTCMKEKLDFDDIKSFEELLDKACGIAWKETIEFLACDDNMEEHIWGEYVKN